MGMFGVLDSQRGGHGRAAARLEVAASNIANARNTGKSEEAYKP